MLYTVWLKPRTPQNIVIGGGAGAFPPLIGWVAVTGDVTLMPLLLFAIIFVWTPPHFWALALFVKTDYAKVGIPMMPVVAGEASTRRQIFLYSLVLLPLSATPWFIGGTGAYYGIAALVLSGVFLVLSVPVAFGKRAADDTLKPEKRLFAFSVSISSRCSRRWLRTGCFRSKGPHHEPRGKIEFDRRRRARNKVVALLLVGFVVLFFAITIVRIGAPP